MSVGDSEKVHRHGSAEQWANQILALLWVVVGVVIIKQALDLPYGAKFGPGPGFLPFWLGLTFIVLGLVLLAQVTFSRKEREVLALPSKSALRQMFLVMVGYSVFVSLGETVGFLLCIGLLFLYLLVVVERKGWKFSLAVSIGCTFVFWVIFELGLQMHLPLGFLELLQ